MEHVISQVVGLGALLVPIAAIVVGGVIAVTSMILRHNERIARIEHGLDPDGPVRVSGQSAGR